MRVLVLGGGYAGVVLTRALEDSLPEDVDILVVDESGDHLVQHELHRVVRRPALAETITIPLTELFDRARVRVGSVVDVDTTSQSVELADGDRLDYDVAAICLGALTDFHDMPDVERHAHPLKRIADAEAIRTDTLAAFESMENPQLVVGGAGLAGIQLAGELAALAREENVDAAVVLLEQAARIAPTFDEAFADALADALSARDIDVRTSQTVTGATETSVTLDAADSIPYDVFVWTGGIRGPDATGGDRPTVRATLALDDRTFVVGDAGTVIDDEGRAVPPSAQSAVREARLAATNVARAVSDGRAGGTFRPRFERFTFDSPGWLVSVGDGAVAQVGSTILRGQAAKTLKVGVGAGYLASAGAIRDALSLVRGEYESKPRD